MTRTILIRTVDAGLVEVEEPAWCLGEHEQGGYRADITHYGAPVAAEVETGRGAVEFLEARISWAPFAELQPEPQPVAAVDVDGLGSLSPAQLREVAAELALYAGRLYRLSNELDRLRRNGS
ncbi:DUF6907 domain-containing protein [Streptomyces sp. NPDC055722]